MQAFPRTPIDALQESVYGLLARLRSHSPDWLRLGILSAVIRRLHLPPLYETGICSVIKRTVQPGWICADVGAHVGIITEFLASLVGPDGLVIAFEPHPGNVQRLFEKVRRVGYEKLVKVEPLAVNDGSSDRVWLFPSADRSSSRWNILGPDSNGESTEPELGVLATSLDAYFAGSCLDFVKIDVEGAEAQVLAGMRRLLREARPVVVIEFHDETGWAGRRELCEAGYDLYDMKGEQVDPARGSSVTYHCLALPQGINARKNELGTATRRLSPH